MKKIERPIYIRNVDRMFNKKRPIKHMVEANIYYQEYRKRIEIDVIEGQKWNIILGMPWLVLRLMPQGCIIEMGRGYDDIISCAVVVSVSTSCNRYSCLALSLLFPHII